MSEPLSTEALRALLVRADSYLSLLWYRHVPAERKDVDLQINVERTISELRNASRAIGEDE